MNLITQHACSASPVIHDSLQWVYEVGVLFGQSVKSQFSRIFQSQSGSVEAIRPLCPIRWTVRTCAIRAVLNQYQPMLLAMEETACGHSELACKCFAWAFTLALEATRAGVSQCFSSEPKSDSRQHASECQLCEGHNCKKRGQRMHSKVFTTKQQMLNSLNLSPIEMPRARKPPIRLIRAQHMYPFPMQTPSEQNFSRS